MGRSTCGCRWLRVVSLPCQGSQKVRGGVAIQGSLRRFGLYPSRGEEAQACRPWRGRWSAGFLTLSHVHQLRHVSASFAAGYRLHLLTVKVPCVDDNAANYVAARDRIRDISAPESYVHVSTRMLAELPAHSHDVPATATGRHCPP